ncbi:unnamed protein product [Sphagnum troendelagicum]|uniref:Uncharacterized protein n=1 Tax=Sphagnum troendelagicum TaxID=128251 RepID=A0ABP0UZZ3_9BRYO
MRREGRLSGKPSNKSRTIAGRGVTGEVRCCCSSSSSSSSHKKKNHTLIPVSKSQSKVKGRLKRSAYDVTFNHLLEDWRVCSSSRLPFIAPHSRTARKPSPASQSLWDSDTDQSSGEVCDPCENDEDAGKLQQEQQEEGKDEVSAMAIMIDTALQNMRNRKRKPQSAACLLTENHEEARREEEVDASGYNQAEIPDCYKAACNNNELRFGSFFRDEMIVASSQQHKNRARSEDSWSEIELSEPDIMSQESWEEDEES